MQDRDLTKSDPKIVIFGDANTGKTKLITRFISNTYNQKYKYTIGSDFLNKEIDVQGKGKRNVVFWDTAGQERFSAHEKGLLYMNLDVAIIAFDLTNKKSFDKVQDYIDKIEGYNLDPKPKIILVGTKADSDDELKKVTKSEINALQKALGCAYFETSAKEGTNVDEMGNTAGNLAVESFDKRQAALLTNDKKSTSEDKQSKLPGNFLTRHWRKILLGILIVGGAVAIGVATGGLGLAILGGAIASAVVVGAAAGAIVGAIEDRREKAKLASSPEFSSSYGKLVKGKNGIKISKGKSKSLSDRDVIPELPKPEESSVVLQKENSEKSSPDSSRSLKK